MSLPDRPFRLLPRRAAVALLAVTLAACGWSGFAIHHTLHAHALDIEARTKLGERPDMDLYEEVDARVAQGENYYTAITALHRKYGFPTSPFVAVRTPILAWTTAIWGVTGWKVIAVLLWCANVLVWFAVLRASVARHEAFLGAALAGGWGLLAFYHKIPYSHEGLAGLMLSLALALSFRRNWWAGLLLAVFGIALRELALPFLFAWGAIALLDKDGRRVGGIAAALAFLGVLLFLHAQAVAAVRLPGDLVSVGWHGMVGPALPFYGIDVTTVLVDIPSWIAGPLIALALLGWLSLGGRLGAFASLWFVGFGTFVAIFARPENFYWMGLFVSAYGVGLAFAPRAVADLVRVLARPPAPAPTR